MGPCASTTPNVRSSRRCRTSTSPPPPPLPMPPGSRWRGSMSMFLLSPTKTRDEHSAGPWTGSSQTAPSATPSRSSACRQRRSSTPWHNSTRPTPRPTRPYTTRRRTRPTSSSAASSSRRRRRSPPSSCRRSGWRCAWLQHFTTFDIPAGATPLSSRPTTTSACATATRPCWSACTPPSAGGCCAASRARCQRRARRGTCSESC
mmetsp:Transcript_13719/g.45762  ORF Transcript_13719/g.45762 Transcript_13719/m.45762 type:complete len:204 (-) Transcript_13719:1387-1998(-)